MPEASPAASPAPSPAPANDAPVENVERGTTDEKAKVITPQQAEAIKQKIKVRTKIDGVEEETELSEEEIQRDYQLWKASGKRFQESSEMRKQAQEVLEFFKNPKSLRSGLQKMGYTDDQMQQLAEDFLYDRLKLSAMTPEQKELMELKQWRQQKESEENLTKEQSKKKANDEATSQLRQSIEKDVISALQDSAIPPTPANVWRMADKLRINLQRGIHIDAKEAAELVYQDLIKEYKHLSSKLSPDKFAEVIGEDALNMIRKHDLSKVENPIREKRTQKKPGETPWTKTKKGYTSEKDFKKYLDAKKAGA